MICGGHVQASFPFFLILIFFSLSLFFSFPLFHSSSPPTMYSVHLLRYFNLQVQNLLQWTVYATSTSDLAQSQRLVMRGAGPQVQRLTHALLLIIPG